MSPLVVPPRSASLPQGSSSADPSASSVLASSSEATSQFNDGDNSTRILPSVDSIPGSAPSQAGISQQSTTTFSLPYDSNGGWGSHPQPPMFQPPETQSMAFNINAGVPPHVSTVSPYSTTSSAQSTAQSIHPASLMPHIPSGSSSSMLSPIMEDPRQLSRESRVSLPDEAKRYIASIGESPVPSPGLVEFPSASVQGQTRSGQAQITHSAGATVRSSRSKSDHPGSAGGKDEVEFLDMDDDEDRENEQQQQQQPSSSAFRKKEKPHANVDDFPMPPSHGPLQAQSPHIQGTQSQFLPSMNVLTPTQANTRPDAGTPSQTHRQSPSDVFSHSQHSLDHTPSTPVPESPLPDSYLSPTKSTHGGSNAIFRALPLVADDIKTTSLTVSYSSIKANDRGKEVLSFEIEVDPGNSKEPWKVEKLYSDVLALDQRLRAVVGKGVSKKIAALPEGKLWRDHAPAKSDQRKVSTVYDLNRDLHRD
jgi:RalA-binding protein 1